MTRHGHRWGAWLREARGRGFRYCVFRYCVDGWCPYGQWRNGRVTVMREKRRVK